MPGRCLLLALRALEPALKGAGFSLWRCKICHTFTRATDMPPPKLEWNAVIADRIEKLASSGGGITEIAALVRISEPKVRELYAYELEVGLLKDVEFTHTKLREKVADGDVQAMKLFLTTRGKRFGWTERQEVTGADGERLVNPVLGFTMPNGGPGMLRPRESDA